jgi:cell wall-associated NlpC family hydrolase
MRYLAIFILVISLACQSAVRYTSAGEVTDIPANTGNTSVSGQSGPIDQGRMGKIIAGYLRTPYREGGTGKLGLDCSGLVYVVYRDYNGSRLPANTTKLFKSLKAVQYKNIKYGDLVFFSFNGSMVSHVGIYVGNDKFVHASESNGVVISNIVDDYYRTAYKGSRRVLW